MVPVRMWQAKLISQQENQCCGSGSSRIGILFAGQDPDSVPDLVLSQPNVKLNCTFSRKFKNTLYNINIYETFAADEKNIKQ
jgi:hypothetical protein